MNENESSTYHVPSDKVNEVLRALDNRVRLQILQLIKHEPLSITEISRRLKCSQPPITNYVTQLEKAGLIATRMHRSIRGYQKMCSLLFETIQIPIDDFEQKIQKKIYTIDMPVGHYASIDLNLPGLLASEAGIIASFDDDVSSFYYPIRMEAELLVVGESQIAYIFPCNINDEAELLGLELTAEIATAFPAAQAPVDVVLQINQQRFPALRLKAPAEAGGAEILADWYPPGLARSGQLTTWRLDASGASIEDQTNPDFTIHALNRHKSRVLDVTFIVHCAAGEQAGAAFFGKTIGAHGQDFRLKLTYTNPALANNNDGRSVSDEFAS